MEEKSLGERIRELRDKKDLSLRELGKKLNHAKPISAAFLSDVELGRRFPTDELLAQMASALDTTLEDLKKYDTRVPVNELKKLASDDPVYGLALRRVIDQQVSAEELMKLLDKAKGKGK